MSAPFHYVNLTKRLRLAGAIGDESDQQYTLASRAFHLFLHGLPSDSSSSVTDWANDSIVVISESDPNWEQVKLDYADIEADTILFLIRDGGFEKIGDAAERDQFFFMQLCYLVSTRQGLMLEPHLKARFGPQYLERYKRFYLQWPGTVSKDCAQSSGKDHQ